MLLPVLLLALLTASDASPELDAFLQAALQDSARAAVAGDLEPLLLPSGSLLSGLSGLRIEDLERTGTHRKFRFTARIPVLHASSKSSEGVVLLVLRNLRISFRIHLASSGASLVLSSISALPPRLSSSRVFVSGFARGPSMRRVAEFCGLAQHRLLSLFKSQLKDALSRHTTSDIHLGSFKFDKALYDSRRVRAVKDAVAAAVVALRDGRPFFWREGWRRFRLSTTSLFADPEASPRRHALLLQLDLEGLRLVERRQGRLRRTGLDLKVLVVLQRRGVGVRLTGLDGEADGIVLNGLLAWVASELTPALRRALVEVGA